MPQQISSLSFEPPEQISSLLPCRSATAPCWRCPRFVERMLHLLSSNWYVFPTIATSLRYFQPRATRPLVGASDYCTSCSHRFHITGVYHSSLVTQCIHGRPPLERIAYQRSKPHTRLQARKERKVPKMSPKHLSYTSQRLLPLNLNLDVINQIFTQIRNLIVRQERFFGREQQRSGRIYSQSNEKPEKPSNVKKMRCTSNRNFRIDRIDETGKERWNCHNQCERRSPILCRERE